MNLARRSPFSTHRGKAVRRVVTMAGAVAVGLMVLSGLSSGTRPDEASQMEAQQAQLAAAMGATEDKDPVVLPAIANPSTNKQIASTVDPNRDPLTNRAIVRIKTQGDNDNLAATQVAQKVAVAWGTYSWEQTAEQFVGTLPSLAPGEDAAILNSIVEDWAGVQESKAVVTASLAGTAPVVQVLDASKGTATIAVTVEQSAEGSPAKPVRYVVQLSRYEVSREVPADDAEPSAEIISKTAWGVIGVRKQ